jgi:hypothetical protein
LIELVPTDSNNILEQLKQQRNRISDAIALLRDIPGVPEGEADALGGQKHAHLDLLLLSRLVQQNQSLEDANYRRLRSKLSEAAKARWAKAKKAGKTSL